MERTLKVQVSKLGQRALKKTRVEGQRALKNTRVEGQCALKKTCVEGEVRQFSA